MSKIPDDELEEEIAWNKDLLDSALSGFEDTPEEERPYFRLARSARPLGVYHLLLGERDESVAWFAKSAKWFNGRWQQVRGGTNEPQMAMWMLLTAVLSRDADLADQMAERIVEDGIEHSEPAYFTQFDACLANLIVGNDEAAIDAADSLAEMEPEAPEEVQYYPGLGDACRAIVDGDVAAFDAALDRILVRHEELVPTLGETADDAVICIPATVYLLVADDRGLSVTETDAFDSKYVPQLLFE